MSSLYPDSEPTSICSFSLILRAYRRSNKYQFYSRWFDPIGTRTHDLLEASTLTIKPPMWFNDQKERDIQWSIKHYRENKKLSDTNFTKNVSEIVCFGRVRSSCLTSDTRHGILIKNMVTSHERGSTRLRLWLPEVMFYENISSNFWLRYPGTDNKVIYIQDTIHCICW
jgi:hypothetical protein